MKFNYARDALEYLIQKFKIKEMYIPYYLCDVIRHTVYKCGCKPLYYHIDDNFFPAIDFPESAYILYPNYFGICDKNVEKLVKIYPKIIVDNAHALYFDCVGFACFNSYRKFLPVQSGADLWINTMEKAAHRFTPDKSRREKFDEFHRIYASSNMLHIDLTKDSIPFCYPYLAPSIEDADKLAERLKNDGKIIYRYWNSLPSGYNEYKFYSRLVPIPLGYSGQDF